MTSTGQLKSVLSMITQGRRLWKAMSGDIVISACNGRSKNLEGNVGGFCCLCTEMLHVTPLAAYWSELVICPALNARGLEVWSSYVLGRVMRQDLVSQTLITPQALRLFQTFAVPSHSVMFNSL